MGAAGPAVATNNYRLENGGFETGPQEAMDVRGAQWLTPNWLAVNFGEDQRVRVEVDRSSPLAGMACLRVTIGPSAGEAAPAWVEIRQRVFNLALFPRDLEAQAWVRASAPGSVSLVLDEGFRRSDSIPNAQRDAWEPLRTGLRLRGNRIKYNLMIAIRPPPEGVAVDIDEVRAWSPEREKIDRWLKRIYAYLRSRL